MYDAETLIEVALAARRVALAARRVALATSEGWLAAEATVYHYYNVQRASVCLAEAALRATEQGRPL